jgi:hypothetical protein
MQKQLRSATAVNRTCRVITQTDPALACGDAVEAYSVPDLKGAAAIFEADISLPDFEVRVHG